MLAIGLMSGTSMDGVDAALIETDGMKLLNEIGDIFLPYSDEFRLKLKEAEKAVRAAAEIDINNILAKTRELYPSFDAVLNELDDIHIRAVKLLLEKTKYQNNQIELIGYHGQAFYHNPSKKTSIVLGDRAKMAGALKIRTINDFRSADVRAGGQGAPFAPIYHLALATKSRKTPCAIINCGGIANVTIIKNDNELDLIGFDTGAGNGLIDKLVRERTRGEKLIDRDGEFALKGMVHKSVLQALYQKSIIKNGQNYFDIPSPKSLDSNDLKLIPELDQLSLEDACATLAEFTADSIYKALLPYNLEYFVIAGGGAKNPAIMKSLASKLGNLFSADEIGWNSDALEAQLFAYLAVRSFKGLPLSFPGTTRVPYPMKGGVLHEV